MTMTKTKMNHIYEIMTKHPVCCFRETKIEKVAALMVQNDCGEIPVIDAREGKKLIGVITDRDIVVRSVARGINPLELTAEECMTENPVCVTREMTVEDVCHLMEENQIRRVPVVDSNEDVCGMVSLADIASAENEEITGEIVKYISQPNHLSPHIAH